MNEKDDKMVEFTVQEAIRIKKYIAFSKIDHYNIGEMGEIAALISKKISKAFKDEKVS